MEISMAFRAICNPGKNPVPNQLMNNNNKTMGKKNNNLGIGMNNNMLGNGFVMGLGEDSLIMQWLMIINIKNIVIEIIMKKIIISI